jgi:Cu+-exporting ATPase
VIKMVKDPVCGMEVSKDTKFKSEYNGNTYYFCSRSCKDEFDKNPKKYINVKRSGC